LRGGNPTASIEIGSFRRPALTADYKVHPSFNCEAATGGCGSKVGIGDRPLSAAGSTGRITSSSKADLSRSRRLTANIPAMRANPAAPNPVPILNSVNLRFT
jgi:hypothetical protein